MSIGGNEQLICVRDSPQAGPDAGHYSLKRVALDGVDDPLISEWRAFSSLCSDTSPMHHPEWLMGFFAGHLPDTNTYLLYHADAVCGAASFISKNWPLKWHLGELCVAKMPLRRFRLLGGVPLFPQDERAYDSLFSELAKPSHLYDAIQLEEVPLDSFLWKYIHASPLIRRTFRVYTPEPPSAHLLLRFQGSFEDYMKKFSNKHRYTLLKKVKRIREGALGEMRLVEFTAPAQVSEFLVPAVEISKKTYQWHLLQRGLRATTLLKERMMFAARTGSLRSYLLICNEIPCAFIVGFQHNGVFLMHEVGFDPAFSKYSLGTVLQLLVIEQLFSKNRPDRIDFEAYGQWKETLSTESYLETKLILFRPGLYTRCVQEGHRISHTLSSVAASALERLQLKTKVKALIRGWSTPTH